MMRHLLPLLLVAHAAAAESLTARVFVPRGAAMPEVIEARTADADVRCPVSNSVAHCELPVGAAIDVRFFAEGFAPIYVWGINGADAGELRFRRGAIVTGYARPGGRGEAADGIRVELRPSSLAWSPADMKRIGAQTRTAETDARGFFQFDGVEPGEYVAAATKDGWSPAEYRVHVSDIANEARVGREIVLAPLSRIEVAITPPVDSQQKPWEVELLRTRGDEQIPVVTSAASLTGQWSHAGLESGYYSIDIRDTTAQSNVASESMHLDGTTQYVAIKIKQVIVRGTLTLDGEPVAARLRFQHMYEGIGAELASDTEGRFAGLLRSEGKWDIQVTRAGARERTMLKDVEVRRGDDGDAELELELPAGRVRGTVVTPEGSPVQATLYLFRKSRSVGGARTEQDGTFDFIGIEPGEIEISARAQGRESGLLPHTIRSMDDEPMTIIVPKVRTTRVRVLAPDGRRVAGARVTWRAMHFSKDDVTGPDGEVAIKVPPTQAALTFAVVAVGYPAKLMIAPTEDDVITAVLPAVSGQLFLALDGMRLPYPMVDKGGASMNIGALMFGEPFREGMPVRAVPGGFLANLEPGEYTICMPLTTKCETRVLRPGARESIDATKWQE